MKDIFYFKSNEKNLFSVFTGTQHSSEKLGVVFCHPYAEEKQRVDRITVKLSRDLEGLGIPSLRFDCVGYGDSQGEFEESTIESQLVDIGNAIDEISHRTEIDHIYLFGIRFGATLASIRAEIDSRVKGLILWSPIVSGKDYFDLLCRNKVFSSFGDNNKRLTKDDVENVLKMDKKVDIDGYFLTENMARELQDLNINSIIKQFSGDVFLGFNNKYDKGIDDLKSAYIETGASVHECGLDGNIYWDMKSHYEWLFPSDLMEMTESWIKDQNGGN